MSSIIKLRLELSYDLLAIVRARLDKNATTLLDRHHIVVLEVQFLASFATRVDLVDVADASYDHYTCQYSLRGSQFVDKRERYIRSATTYRECLALRQDSRLLYDRRLG